MHYEYTLVIFTVFGQLAAGIALLVFFTGLHKDPAKERQAWIIALVAGVIAMLGSTLHLSSLWGAPYLATKLGSSWIAREVAMGAVFGVLVLLRLLKKISPSLNPVIAIAGLCFVGTMSQVYKTDIIPLWNTCGTELSFFGTALLLGAAFITPFLTSEKEEKSSRICAVCFLVGVLASASLPLFWMQGIILFAADPSILASFVIVSLCLGLSMTTLHIVGGVPLVMGLKNKKVLYGGAGLVLLASFMGRMLFYAANIKLGILGL